MEEFRSARPSRLVPSGAVALAVTLTKIIRGSLRHHWAGNRGITGVTEIAESRFPYKRGRRRFVAPAQCRRPMKRVQLILMEREAMHIYGPSQMHGPQPLRAPHAVRLKQRSGLRPRRSPTK